MRSLTLVLVLSACAVFAASTDLGEVSHGGAAYVTPEPNGFLDLLYETIEFDYAQLVNGIATAPSYGWVSADDFILDEDSVIEDITYWVLVNSTASGYVHRFWNDTGGSGPGSELDQAPATYELTSTGYSQWGYVIYECNIDIDPDYEIGAGHYWGASWFTSGFWYIAVASNAWDDMAYFDYGGSGSGPWYSSQSQWGAAYGFFQVINGTMGEPEFDPPYVTGMDPDDGEADVPLDSNIVFHCIDDEHDVDVDTIDFTAADSSLGNGYALSAGSPNRTLAGDFEMDETDPADIVCTFDPDDDFYCSDTITCTVAAGLADEKGNPTEDDFVWTFTTESCPSVTQTTWGAIKADF
jgi:hypothetical protein